MLITPQISLADLVTLTFPLVPFSLVSLVSCSFISSFVCRLFVFRHFPKRADEHLLHPCNVHAKDCSSLLWALWLRCSFVLARHALNKRCVARSTGTWIRFSRSLLHLSYEYSEGGHTKLLLCKTMEKWKRGTVEAVDRRWGAECLCGCVVSGRCLGVAFVEMHLHERRLGRRKPFMCSERQRKEVRAK